MKATTSNTHALLTGTILVTLILLSGCGTAIGDRIQEGAERGVQQAVERETRNRTDRATTEVIDGFENAVRCVVDDRVCAERARAEGRDIVYVDEDGNEVSAERNVPENVSANYDFQRGERILFRDDFTRDNVGDFPRRLEFLNGNMEVVDANGRRVLRATSHSGFAVPLPETLPDRFTLEFTLAFGSDDHPVIQVLFDAAEGGNVSGRAIGWYQHPHLQVHSQGEAGIYDFQEDSPFAINKVRDFRGRAWFEVRLMADGEHVKAYVDNNRVANIPQARLGRDSKIWFALDNGGLESGQIFIGPITVAAGGKDLYSTLEAEGRVTTEGIFFDTGSARIRSESASALGEIAALLREHPDLRLRIEGHTDNAGSASSNQTLSEGRAEAVRDYLVNDEGIGATRLEAHGMGEDHPVADNGTETGRQQNRRVDLVRL